MRIDLAEALICLDCESVVSWRDSYAACPACGSRQMWPLNKWIESAKEGARDVQESAA